jgi:retinol dehydrogenase 12
VARNTTTGETILKEIQEVAPKVEVSLLLLLILFLLLCDQLLHNANKGNYLSLLLTPVVTRALYSDNTDFDIVKVTFLECNLGSLASVRGAAKQVLSSNQRLDVLLCNAGILDVPLGLSADGYEIHFGVNYLGHALLINLLLPLLLKTTEIQPDVRVILLASSGYRFHDPRGIIFKDLRTTQQNLTRFGMFGGMLRYFQSKLAIILFTVELARRYPMIKVVAVHPGIIDTPLTPHWVKANAFMRLITAGGEGGIKKPEEGSWNQLWAATGSGVISGEYYEPIGILGTRTKKSKDQELRNELWEWTEEQLNGWRI